jgi:hypothetical protein
MITSKEERTTEKNSIPNNHRAASRNLFSKTRSQLAKAKNFIETLNEK